MSKFKVGQKVISLKTVRNNRVEGEIITILKPITEIVGKVWYMGAEGMVVHADEEEFMAIPCPSSHYTPDSTGKDYLARCEDTFSREEMIGAYRFTLGKYVDRMGKKTGEPVEKELAKIIDYATRAKAWLERSNASE